MSLVKVNTLKGSYDIHIFIYLYSYLNSRGVLCVVGVKQATTICGLFVVKKHLPTT